MSEHVYLNKGDFAVCASSLEQSARYWEWVLKRGDFPEDLTREEAEKVLGLVKETLGKIEVILRMGPPTDVETGEKT